MSPESEIGSVLGGLKVRLRPHGRTALTAAERAARLEAIFRRHRLRATVMCGAIAAVPGVGAWLDLVALAEVNVQQIRDIADLYGFDLEPYWQMPIVQSLPLVRQPGLIMALSLAALETGQQWQSLAVRMTTLMSRRLGRRLVGRTARRLLPFIGSGVAAVSSYQFTRAVGEQAVATLSALPGSD